MFPKTVQSLCHCIAANRGFELNKKELDELLHFIWLEFYQLPLLIRIVITCLILCFSLSGVSFGFTVFHLLNKNMQQKQIMSWQKSNFSIANLLIQFFQSLVLLKLYSDKTIEPNHILPSPLSKGLINLKNQKKLTTEVAVIGSGPGGAITATLLAEAGFKVLLIEEGDVIKNPYYQPFSATEFSQLLRYGGLGIMFGNNTISYLEGCCLGGGSEINSGLYLHPQAAVLQQWEQNYGLKNCLLGDLKAHLNSNEKDLKVSYFKGKHPLAGLKLAQGAKAMGWQVIEVEKMRQYKPNGAWSDINRNPYQSMNKSFLPRFIEAHGQIVTNSRVTSLKALKQGWQLNVQHSANKNSYRQIKSKHLFIAAGAVQTPSLLRRSGINKNIGNSLQTSLIVKVIARFNEKVNFAEMGMPVQQVREFSPKVTFACAISNKAQLAIGLQAYPHLTFDLNTEWPYLAMYSVILAGSGYGKVRNGISSPWVSYRISNQDWQILGTGLKQLMELLLTAGASEIYPVMKLADPIRRIEEIKNIPDNIKVLKPSITSLHLSSSCPMGENQSLCATDSYGQVFGHDNLYINDASLLCSYPGANPQATLMAVARRNVEKFIQEQRKQTK
jgi:choline dehydrogenase-like flavoprotein